MINLLKIQANGGPRRTSGWGNLTNSQWTRFWWSKAEREWPFCGAGIGEKSLVAVDGCRGCSWGSSLCSCMVPYCMELESHRNTREAVKFCRVVFSNLGWIHWYLTKAERKRGTFLPQKCLGCLGWSLEVEVTLCEFGISWEVKDTCWK